MRKLDLTGYVLKGIQGEYNVKDNVVAVIFNRQLQLNAKEAYERGKLADKIEEAKNEILLEEGDFEIIKQAFNKFRGFGLADRELCRRVIECKKIEVEEKKK